MKPIVVVLVLILAAAARAEIMSSPEAVTPLTPGADLPKVDVRMMDGRTVKLDEALASQPTVFVVYRGGWCPYCTKQLAGLQTVLPELHALGYRLVALSPDPVADLKKTLTDAKLDYTLLSDHTFAAIEALGLAFALDAKTIETYKGYGIPLYSPPGSDAKVLPVPAVFLTDRAGRIAFTHTNPDYRKRLATKALLKAARANP
ncbi:MAG TPA: peroxiredoxin-like family protein [Kiritimatiellia bacterium]|nr:peroxiredoxin-like family protein [Kiritimatiellia bacterium]